ncbi:conserved exported protein of unknown function [Modestobacter italicus]|uniref:Uncharacterized protein n=1 Tax=Modestobacter italicus (strain DSM 44449 / CECT 9708 / BC 501) TaxID=2732864 RepID=I4EWI3_MODI5|nr:HNH endonuclease signature motif containing protein [Modestobacter marinus]CCH87746.1 conserved exported protein of unknown function [Modestobacter marinus]
MTSSTAVQQRSAPAVRERSTGSPVLPAVAVSAGPLGVVQAADREIARLTAVRARAVAEFAASRPASVDRRQGEPGAMSAERWAARAEVLQPVSEWATSELQVALALGQQSAEDLLERSLRLVSRLPGVLAGLEAGGLHVGHMWPMLDLVADIADDSLRAEVEAEVLDWVAARAAGGTLTTPAQLRDKARRVIARRGARDAAQRLAKAVKNRGVQLRAGADGMAAVTALLTGPEGQALHAALGAYADAVQDEPGAEPRTRGQKMADCLMDLVLRPGEGDRPPVQVALTLVAAVGTVLGGDAPGECNGQVVPAEVVRQLLRLLAGTPTADPVPADTEAADVHRDHGGAPEPVPDPDVVLDPGGVPDPDAVRDFVPDGDHDDLGCISHYGGVPDPDAVPVPDGTPDAGGTPDPDVTSGLDGVPDPDAVLLCDGDPVPDPAEVALFVAMDAALREVEQRWWADFERGLITDPDPVEDRRPSGSARPGSPWAPPSWEDSRPLEPPASSGASVGDGWWAAADRAVDDASQAQYQARQALAHAERLVRTAARADAADEVGWRAGPAGRVDAAGDALQALASAARADRQALAGLLSRTAGGGLADRPRIALVDALTGALVSLTDLPELRRTGQCGRSACRRDPAACAHDLTGRPGLGAPGPTDGYRPGAALDRFVRARDRRCRFPGCRRLVAAGELDHRIRYPDGPTSISNLAGFCVTDHRGKHQAPDWTFHLAEDATLTVTTPTGLVATTGPPPS